MDSTAFFDKVKNLVKDEGLFDTWFSDTYVTHEEGEAPVLKVPHDFSKKWICQKYQPGLNRIAKELWQQPLNITSESFEPTPKADPTNVPKTLKTHQKSSVPFTPADSDFVYENFIAGRENALPLVAAKSVRPGDASHSPLVLVGGHGMGKSHLASAIARQWEASKVCFLHAEEFANAYIQAAKDHQLDDLRKMTRGKSLFVIEDIDFFLDGNKKKTLQELVNTLKVLKRDNKQVVVTSRAAICEYAMVDKSFCDFLLSGLKVRISDIQSGTRTEIIEHYLTRYKSPLSKKVREFLSSLAFESPGELKSALKQLLAFSTFEKGKLSLVNAKEILSDHLRRVTCPEKDPDSGINLQMVARCVSDEFGVSVARLTSSSRERHTSKARHMAMALSHDLAQITLREIGHFYGGRLHQSVLFGIQKSRKLNESEASYRRVYQKCAKTLQKRVKNS